MSPEAKNEMKTLKQRRQFLSGPGAKDCHGGQPAPFAPLRLGVMKFFPEFDPEFDGDRWLVRDAEGLVVFVGTKREVEDWLDFQENQERLKEARS